MVELYVLDTTEPPHEVKMPVAPAKLSVSDNMIARRLLLGDKVFDGAVLDRCELRCRDGARLEVGTSLLECFWSQEASHVVIPERGM